MKKIFNFRPIVLCLLSFLIGASIALSFFMHQNFVFWLLILFFVSIFLIWIVLSKKLKLNKIIVGVCFIFAVVGIVVMSLNVVSYSNTMFNENVEYLCTGRITQSLGLTKSGYYNAYLLENVSLNSKSKHIRGEVICYISTDKDYGFKVGNVLTFNAKLDFLSAEEIVGTSNYRLNVSAIAFARGDILLKKTTSLTIFESVREFVYDKLSLVMSSENASLFYAMLVGDTSKLESDTYSLFSDAGISHLLAISGLHIGFLVLLLTNFLGKIGVKKDKFFYIVCPLLFVYTFLCGFTPSVTRAFIMASVSLFASCCGRQYDGLCSLSFSALIILFFKPMFLLDKGFLLSFVSVLSILTIMPVIKNICDKFMSAKASSAVSLVVSAQLGVTPLAILFFGKVSLLSIFINIILVPIASFAYMLVFVFVVICVFMPYCAILLKAPEFLMDIVKNVSTFVVNVPGNNLLVDSTVLMTLPLALIFPFSGDYCFCKQKTKSIVFCLLLIIYIVLLFAFNL